MSWFKLKKTGDPRDIELSMAGLKLGSKVLQVGGTDPGLIAALAKKVGLSGRAAAVGLDGEAVMGFERAAEQAGVLLEVKMARLSALPFDDGDFDVVVLKHVLGTVRQHERVLCVQQVRRVLRIGGRCLVIDQEMRGGLGAVLSRQQVDTRYLTAGGGAAALKHEGFAGVRVLAERAGLSFVEGLKPQPDADG